MSYNINYTGRVLYVAKNGDNTNAQVGNRFKPYNNPWAAMQVSILGDRVVITDNSEYSCGPVGSGADFESDDVTKYNLALDRRTLIGMNGATITNHASAASSTLFSDNPDYFVDRVADPFPSTGLVFRVIGNINVDWNADAPFMFQHEDSEFEGEFHDITFTSTTLYSHCFALYGPYWDGWIDHDESTYPTDPFYYGGRVKRFEIKAHKIDVGTQNLFSGSAYFNYSDSTAYLYPTAYNIYDGYLFSRNQLSRGYVKIDVEYLICGRNYCSELSNYDVFLNIGFLQGGLMRGMTKNWNFIARIDRAEYNPNYRNQNFFAYGGGQDSLYDVEVGSAHLDRGFWIPNTLGNGAVHRIKMHHMVMAEDATGNATDTSALSVVGGTRIALSNDVKGKVYFEGNIISPRTIIYGINIANTLTGVAGTYPKDIYVSNTRIYAGGTSVYSSIASRDVNFGGGNVFNSAMNSNVNALGLTPTVDTNIPL